MSEFDRPERVEVFTASSTLTARYGGILLVNRGAAGSVTLTLPAGQKGLRIRARKVTAQTFTLACAGSDTILNSAGGSVTSLALNVSVELQHDGTAWLVENEEPAATGTIATAQLADDAVTAAKVADGAIDAAAKIGGGVVTPPKLVGTGIFAGHFVARNGAGAITLTGAVIGQRVLIGWKSGDASDHLTAGEGSVDSLATFTTLFESAITVTDQIQQASASNLSDNKYTVILLPAAA